MPQTHTPRAKSAAVLTFDPQTRRSSRREVVAAATLRQLDASQSAQARRLAQQLGVDAQALDANGGRLRYHGAAVVRIEQAHRQGPEAFRAALLAELFEYHELGYRSGLDDGSLGHAAGR